MSAVSAEFSRGERDAKGKQPVPAGTISTSSTDFGPNEWLVDELYQRYQADPSSVDRAWWSFFADYRPEPVDARRPRPQVQSPDGAGQLAQGKPALASTQAPPAQPGSGQPGPAQPGPAQPRPAQPRPAQPRPAQPTPAQAPPHSAPA